MAQLLFFGKLQDIVGQSSRMIDLPKSVYDTADLRAYLSREFNLGNALTQSAVRVSINSEIVKDPSPVSNSDEIAFLPPVGGG